MILMSDIDKLNSLLMPSRAIRVNQFTILIHGTHLYLHRGAILLDYWVGTFIGRRRIRSNRPGAYYYFKSVGLLGL